MCELLRDFTLVSIADPIYTSGDVGTVLQSFEPLDATPSPPGEGLFGPQHCVDPRQNREARGF